MQTDVSIIIPTKNNQEQLNLCLNSIYNCKKKFTFEIIVVDDFSHQPIKVVGGNAQVVLNKNKSGPSGARNYGSKIATGKYLIFIDSDVELENDALLKLYDSITTQGIDAVFGIYSVNYPYKKKNFLGSYKNLYWHFKLLSLSKNTYLIHTNIFTISQTLFNEVGGFNEKIKVGEDLDFGQKLYRRKKYVLLNKKIFFRHHKLFNNFLDFFIFGFINSFYGSFLLHNNKIGKNIPIIGVVKLISNFLISSIILILSILLIFDFSYLILLVLFFSIFIFYSINKRLFYLFYYENGLAFSIKSSIVYFIESLISQIAIIFALLYRLIVIKKKNEFKR